MLTIEFGAKKSGGKIMRKLIIIFISFFISLPYVHATNLDDKQDRLYPNRKYYPQLNYISTNHMIEAVKTDKYNVIDARPPLGYKTLHIKEADNFSASDEKFEEKLMAIINKNNKPIAFYCGGLACLKSYKASAKAIDLLQKKKINRNVYTYDSGISAFAQASPEWVLKNGKDVSPDNPLLDIKKLKKHAKGAEEFINLVNSDKNNQYIILDVREKKQQMLRKLFMFKKEKKLTVLQPEKLIEFFNEVKRSGRTLMIYGSVEKQIESIFPLVKTAGIKKWFYLEGGEVTYSNYMVKQYVN